MIPTFSPQGDGNLNLSERQLNCVFELIPTFSPQGDGNDYLLGVLGRGLLDVDPYLFPARGRKLHVLD